MSEPPDGESRVGRRTYLKGLAATGLAGSLAGCSLGTKSSSVVGFDSDWARGSGYVSADHRKVEKVYPKFVAVGKVTATVRSHAVTYSGEETATGPTSAFGTITTPNVGGLFVN